MPTLAAATDRCCCCCWRLQASKPSGADDTKPKKDGERIKYSKEFLMQFMDVSAGDLARGAAVWPCSSLPACTSARGTALR